MKATLLGALSFIGIALLVVLVFGPDRGMVREQGEQNIRTDLRGQNDARIGDIPTAILRAADSQTPAAGVCDGSSDPIVSVAIMEDVPSPRCAKVVVGQKLRIENRTMERITVSFTGTTDPVASRVYPIVPGDAVLMDMPVERYLASGVHHLEVSGYSSPEIWFDAPREGSLELLER